jgi:hypothetical protein
MGVMQDMKKQAVAETDGSKHGRVNEADTLLCCEIPGEGVQKRRDG